MNFIVKNYGVKYIDSFLAKYQNTEVSKKTIQELKDDIFNFFINNPTMDFSTKGNVSVMIVDRVEMTNCEIIYSN